MTTLLFCFLYPIISIDNNCHAHLFFSLLFIFKVNLSFNRNIRYFKVSHFWNGLLLSYIRFKINCFFEISIDKIIFSLQNSNFNFRNRSAIFYQTVLLSFTKFFNFYPNNVANIYVCVWKRSANVSQNAQLYSL